MNRLCLYIAILVFALNVTRVDAGLKTVWDPKKKTYQTVWDNWFQNNIREQERRQLWNTDTKAAQELDRRNSYAKSVDDFFNPPAPKPVMPESSTAHETYKPAPVEPQSPSTYHQEPPSKPNPELKPIVETKAAESVKSRNLPEMPPQSLEVTESVEELKDNLQKLQKQLGALQHDVAKLEQKPGNRLQKALWGTSGNADIHKLRKQIGDIEEEISSLKNKLAVAKSTPSIPVVEGEDDIAIDIIDEAPQTTAKPQTPVSAASRMEPQPDSRQQPNQKYFSGSAGDTGLDDPIEKKPDSFSGGIGNDSIEKGAPNAKNGITADQAEEEALTKLKELAEPCSL